jgi:hypothetical protein
MTLKIENNTHWRSSDIERIIRIAMKRADADSGETRNVGVKYQPKAGGSRISYIYNRVDGAKEGAPGILRINLPKRGPKRLHPNEMITLAAAADIADAGIAADAAVLAVSDTYFLANALAYEFAKEALVLYEISNEMQQRYEDLKPNARSVMPPDWCESSKLIVCKYKDPKKDGTYLDFVKKKKAAIKRAETDIAKAEGLLTTAKRKLKSAKDRKRKAEKALKDAAERRC